MSDGAPRRYYEQRELLYVAVSRVLSTPLFIALTLVAGDEISTALWIMLGAGTLYTISALVLAASRYWDRVDPRLFVLSDMLALAIVMALSGGPTSQVKIVFFIWPIGMTLLFPAREVRLCLLAAVGTYTAVSIPFVAGAPFDLDDPEVRGFALSMLSLAWIGFATLVMAYSFERRQHRIEELSRARQRLLADSLGAEERTRRRLSAALEQETLEVLLAADQDVEAGRGGDAGLLERARGQIRLAVLQIREIVRELHPLTLQRGGLGAGLDAVVERAGREGSLEADVRVDPSASSVHDALLISVARELANNAARHAGATRLTLELRSDGDEVVMTIGDDGAGIDAGAAAQARQDGGIGLATARERVEAVGGRFLVVSQAGEGTRAVIRVPSVPEPPPDRREPGYDQQDLMQLTVARALTAPLFLALIFVAGDPFGGALVWLFAAGVVMTVFIFALSGSSIAMQIDWRIFTAGDLITLGALMAASGGPSSQIAVIYYISPLVICLLYTVRLAAIVLLATMVTFALVSIPFIADEPFSVDSPEVRDLLLVELSLAWIGSISLAVADAFERKRMRIQRLSETRQQVLAQTLAAEDDARRRIAEALHDDALQLLLAAGQDLDAAEGSADGSLDAAGTKLRAAIERLRETARGLDPTSAEHGGLATGLDSVAESAASMGGMEVDVRVEPAASGPHDALLIALARELATNAAKHSRAETLSLRVASDDGWLTLEVADDGLGMDPDRPEDALAEGHIGFASCIERTEAAGGTLLVDSPDAGGTRVLVSLPKPRAYSGGGGGGSSPSQNGTESRS